MTLDKKQEESNNLQNQSKGQYPEIPEEGIVKPEDEQPVRVSKKYEEVIDSDIVDIEDSSMDMDGDGSPDWDPALGPGT